MAHALLALHDGRAPRAWEALQADLAALPPAAQEVALVGEDPTESPHLLKVIEALASAGRTPMLITHGQPLARAERVRTLRARGCRYLGLRFFAGDAAGHDAATGRPGAWARMIQALSACDGLDIQRAVVIDAALDPAALPGLAALARAQHAVLHVFARLDPSARPPPADDPQLDAVIDAAWAAAAPLGVRLRVTGAAPSRTPAPGPARPLDATLVGVVRNGHVPRAARAGVRARGADPALRRDAVALLGALGAPAIDAPACEGGRAVGTGSEDPACAPCAVRARCPGTAAPTVPARLRSLRPGARALVLIPPMSDQVFLASTLPALALALTDRGVPTRVATPWDLRFDPRHLAGHTEGRIAAWLRAARARLLGVLRRRPARDLLGDPLDGPPADVDAITARWWSSLDLGDADLVITHDLAVARRVLDDPRLPARATVVAADFHMLEGARELVDGGWPHGRLNLHACFPGYAPLYDAAGVRLADVHWRPYPLHLPHFTGRTPPEAAPAALCAGRHLRDTVTLVRAAEALGAHAGPIDVITSPDPDLRAAGPLRLLPTCHLVDFVEAVRRSRFLVLPLHPHPSHAAGITVLSMAQAAGRPVVATATPAMLDHVTDGVDGLLVPPGDADALAQAIRRLHDDVPLLRRLSAGAARAARRLSVERWADELIHGAATPTCGPERPW